MLKQVEKREERVVRRHPDGGGAKGRQAPGKSAAAAGRRRPSWLVTGAAVLALGGGLALSRWQSRSRRSPAPVTSSHEDPTEARLRRAVEARPEDAAARFALAEFSSGQGRAFEAIWEYAEARQLGCSDPALPLRLAMALRAGWLVDMSTAQLSEALKVRPDDLQARRELADLRLATGEPERARALLEERREAVWQDADATIALGRARQASGDDPGAAAAYQHALSLDSKSAEAHYRLGRLSLRQGKCDAARDAFFHAMLFDQNQSEYPFYSGMAYLQQAHPGDMERALRFFREALALQPKFAPAHYQSGVALDRMGRRSPALTQYSLTTVDDPAFAEPLPALSRALAAVGNSTDAHRFMGRYYDLKDRPADAVREYERMQTGASESVEAALLVGQVYLRTRQNDRAVAVTDAALKRHPDDPELLERRAVLAINRGDQATARRVLEHWMAVQPKASQPLWLMGRSALLQPNVPEAVSWLEKAVALEPRNPHYLGFLGGALLRSGAPGDGERAVKALAEAVELAPDEAEYRELYGQALQKLGQIEPARQQFLRALDADPSRMATYPLVAQLAWRLNRPGPGAFFPSVVRSAQQRVSEESLLQTYVWRHPEDGAGRLKLARFFCRTAELIRARDQLEQVLLHEPSSAEARRLMQVVQRCQEVM